MSGLTVCLTHDVDRVYKSYQYISHDLVQLKVKNLVKLFSKNNPYWVFDEIMLLEEKYNVKSTFFFLEENITFNIFSPENWKLSLGKYKFTDPKIKKIIQQLDNEGWEIGLHGSYESYQNSDLLKKEKKALEKALGKPVQGIRQHYLNLDIPNTWIIQKEVGFHYDASLGKKNQVGFPDNLYYPFINKESDMLIIPLALMDGYLFSGKISFENAWSKCLNIINEAEVNKAVMVVLWHQRVFNEYEFPGYKDLYEKIILECQQRDAEFLLCRDLLKEASSYGRL
jgi:peptidoglycan/xylan/chitin deacetylase (PgdA/CDA1 family)